MGKTNGMEDIGELMSNFDKSIDPKAEERIVARAGQVFGVYNAWDFNGRVWFEGDRFFCEVWRNHIPREVMSAPTLRELMKVVSERWGDQ